MVDLVKVYQLADFLGCPAVKEVSIQHIGKMIVKKSVDQTKQFLEAMVLTWSVTQESDDLRLLFIEVFEFKFNAFVEYNNYKKVVEAVEACPGLMQKVLPAIMMGTVNWKANHTAARHRWADAERKASGGDLQDAVEHLKRRNLFFCNGCAALLTQRKLTGNGFCPCGSLTHPEPVEEVDL